MVNDDVENIDYFRPIQHREEHFRQKWNGPCFAAECSPTVCGGRNSGVGREVSSFDHQTRTRFLVYPRQSDGWSHLKSSKLCTRQSTSSKVGYLYLQASRKGPSPGDGFS